MENSGQSQTQNSYEKWKKEVLEPSLVRLPERQDTYYTASGIPVPHFLYQSLSPEEILEKLSLPGEFPYTRGVQPTMYRGKLWTMRQYAGYASAEETNQRFKFLLEQGQTGLSVAFDLPTQLGYDADHPLSSGEVGRVGVSISSLTDMQTLFSDIPLDKVSTSMTINAPAPILLAMYVATAKAQGIDISNLRGTIQNDILKEYVSRGTYIFPPQESMRLVTDLMAYCHQYIPRWNTISISGYHMREAGANAVQEVAFTLANGIAYVEAAKSVGLTVDDIAPQLSFFFASHNDFFEEIAKFRAARRMWARIMRDRFNAKDAQSLKLRFHTQTSGSTLTAQQPKNNIVRVTLQALAAVLGGTQSLHTNSMDEALWLPSVDAVRVALRTQQIIAEESGVSNTIDPLGGSYYVEYLTDEVEKRASELITRIDAIGGAVQAIENGFVQAQIQESAYLQQKQVERGESVIVGVNKYRMEEKIKLERMGVDAVQEKQAHNKLTEIKQNRDQQKAQKLLRELESAVKSDENLMPIFIACVENGITLGEITSILRDLWGEYTAPSL